MTGSSRRQLQALWGLGGYQLPTCTAYYVQMDRLQAGRDMPCCSPLVGLPTSFLQLSDGIDKATW